jgi:exonuclease SbcD
VSLTSGRARILLLSDTHLGLDQPRRPRVLRRRRGPEFFAAVGRALAPATRGEVDLVVHGGDVFFRSRVPPGLVEQGLAPFRAVAERGVPVCIVPGNHERSRVPRIHVFDRPRTFGLDAGGLRLALAGFPFVRHGLRGSFPALVEQTAWRETRSDVRLLCFHQCVEGATVGPRGYVFREGDDVVRGADVPGDFAACLAGHVHRHQVLTRDLRGTPLPAPVLYAGSTERTSFAERDERKGFVLVDVAADGSGRGLLEAVRFQEIATRPMVQLDLHPDHSLLGRQHPDAIVRLKFLGRGPGPFLAGLRAETLRALAPRTMNVSVRLSGDPTFRLET